MTERKYTSSPEADARLFGFFVGIPAMIGPLATIRPDRKENGKLDIQFEEVIGGIPDLLYIIASSEGILHMGVSKLPYEVMFEEFGFLGNNVDNLDENRFPDNPEYKNILDVLKKKVHLEVIIVDGEEELNKKGNLPQKL